MKPHPLDPRDQPEVEVIYECPECKRRFNDPDDLRIYVFADGEERKQCFECEFHPDEEIVDVRNIDELDFKY